MMSKTSKFSAMLHCKCPKCRRGSVFTGSMYGWDIQRVKVVCGHCAQKFEIEPGYFFTAMYISYAMNVIEMILLGFLTWYTIGPLTDENFYTYLSIFFLGAIVFYPFNFRYSRIILLHWLTPNIRYESYYDNP